MAMPSEATSANAPLSIIGSPVLIPAICSEKTMPEVIKETALRLPDADALVDMSGRLSFSEFFFRAVLIGRELFGERYLNGKTQQVVALLMPHNSDYVMSMLGIWLANGIFIVIEAHFPETLCKELCEEAGARAAIASSEHAHKFRDADNCRTLTLLPGWPDVLSSLQENDPPIQLPRASPKDIAILSMTSGTTGRPKTIAGSHFFLFLGALAKVQDTVAPLSAEDCREAFNVMFVWEIMRSPMYGYTSFILPDEAVLDPALFVKFLESHRITRTLTTPSLLATILDSGKELNTRLSGMKTWFTCGEVLPMKTVVRFRESLPLCRLVNDYSTWESGDVGYAFLSPPGMYEPSEVFAAAGHEIACGITAVIVDPDTRKVLPQGGIGELYVGGPGVSYGYYGRPDLTDQKFIEAFNDDMQAVSKGQFKWYKTGDLARFAGDAPPTLEIRGRMDSTVKIRGFKVGIPVVEAAIAKVQGVALCCVVPVYEDETSVDSLLCYMKHQDDMSFEEVLARIKQEAVKEIPRWMLPTYFRPFPPNAFSGGEARKLNRMKLKQMADLKQLKAEQLAAQAAQASSQKPVQELSGVRAAVRSVWAKVLNLAVELVDPEENFFDAGGHSALAARMANELSGEYGLPVSVLDIYTYSTLQALSDFVESKTEKEVETKPTFQPKARVMIPDELPRVSVAGLAGRFPGADDADSFFENIKRAAVSCAFLSKEVLRGKGVPETTIAHKDFVPAAYMISNVDKFDNAFFGIGRHEASLMDPQHRCFVETAWAAMENAALPPKGGLSDAVVGVFAAAGIDGYLIHHLDGRPLKDTLDPQDIFLAEIGNEKDYIATRVSYLLDFTGPSMNVNSACSSALVAISQGAAAIVSFQCDAALCGGSSVTFPNLGYLYADGLVSSMDGYVRPFDAGADGTVFGDSVGAVVLRRQKDVGSSGLSWGDLRGFAVTNDGGQKAGYAAPSSNGQARAVTVAMSMMGEDPWSLSYVECHATGTRIGDGIEVSGLMSAFEKMGGKKKAGEASVALGSVKGNIAHANCAAGVTGFIKTLYMLNSRTLVPTANFTKLNPKINFDGSAFFVNNEVSPWKVDGQRPLRAGVSSFGIGGTNAHAIVDSVGTNDTAQANGVHSFKPLSFQLFPFSAKSAGSLRRCSDVLSKRFGDKVDSAVEDIAFTLQAGRQPFPLRKALVVKTGSSLAQELEANFPQLDELQEMEEAKKRPVVAFVFPGQGSQYLDMARGLYNEVPLFKSTCDECFSILSQPEKLDRDLRPFLFGQAEQEDRQKEFDRPSVMQPALFVVEYALSQLLLALRVKPVACAGHSLGEYTAAVVGGFLTLDAALAIVATRAKSTETRCGAGAMLSVASWSPEELEEIRDNKRPGLWLAAVNSPEHSVISGEVEAIDKLEKELQDAGRKCSRLQVQRSFHSGLVEEAASTLNELEISDDGQSLRTLPVASNLTGGWLNAAQLKDGYWAKHMRNTVLWRENAERLLSQWRPSVVLEVGPGNVLSTLCSKCVQPAPAPEYVQTMRHPKATATHDVEAFLKAIGKLWEVGCNIDWAALHTTIMGSAAPPKLLRLPAYAFEPTSLWVNPERSVYVDATEDPSPAAYVAVQGTLTSSRSAPSSKALVRYGSTRSTEPAIRAYCVPFASGSSSIFSTWAAIDDKVIEIIAVELPGRGARSDEALPKDDLADKALLEDLSRAILADLRGAQLVLIGFSMGGNLCMELALNLTEQHGFPLPLALYVAGRKPPALLPSLVSNITMTDSELAAYAFAPPEVASTTEFKDFVVPLLRADLEADARSERRLSSLRGRKLDATTGVELFCGTDDSIAPWKEATGWQSYCEARVGLHYYPGGHEFMQEHRAAIHADWRRDALGRLLQKRMAEVAQLSAQALQVGSGFTAASSSSSRARSSNKQLPLYAVRWVASQAKQGSATAARSFVAELSKLDEGLLLSCVEAAKSGSVLVVVATFVENLFQSSNGIKDEVRQSWDFVRLVQRLLAEGVSARIIVVCPAGANGSMVAGASKAVALEASEMKVQRIFIPTAALQTVKDKVGLICGIANQHSSETDIWIRQPSLQGQAFVQRLEWMDESKSVPLQMGRSGTELPRYLLTGATGGLGQSVVEWLVKEKGLLPEQLVLLRRRNASTLTGILAKCRSVEVDQVDSVESLKSSDLASVGGIAGLIHLAGVLDDGIVGAMTAERMATVAQPKCGLLTALLRGAKDLSWPLEWSIVFSSTSSLFGYAGQVNYCAANAMLDHLAVFGHEDLPCRIIAVNWGPWGEAGMAKVGTKAYEQAVKEGDRPLSTATALACLGVALAQAHQALPSAAQLCACDVDWERSPQWQDLPIIEYVCERGSQPSVPDQKVSTPNGQAAPITSVEEFLSQHSKSGAGSWNRVKGKSLHQLGLDSLELVQIRNAFNKKFNVNVPLGVVADPTQKLQDLATALLQHVQD